MKPTLFLPPLARVVGWTLLLLMIPRWVQAHVKWFSEFSFAHRPLTLSEAVTPLFLGLAVLSMVVIGGCVLLDYRLKDARWYTRIQQWLAGYEEYSTLVMRIGIGVALLLAWQADALLAIELALPAAWIGWFQFGVAFLLLFRRTVPLAGAGLLGLFGVGILQAGAFHMLDYAFFAGAGYFLLVRDWSSERVQASGLPALYLSVGFSLCWAALEKVIYPQWGRYVLEQSPHLTLGFDVDFFLLAAAFVELSLGYLLIIGLLERPMALTVTVVFFTTTLVFGKLEVIGHTPIHAALIVFLLEGPGKIYRAPYTFHQRLPLRMAFAAVNFAVVLTLLLVPYAYGAMQRYERALAETPSHEHPPVELTAPTPIPTVTLTVQQDPIDGWNLHLATTNFRFSPDGVGGPPVPGEGHAHLYLNDEKIARLYGNWYHIPALPPGTYTLRVTLHANNHGMFLHEGAPIADTYLLTIEP